MEKYDLKNFDDTLTQEELDAPDYLDWSDETLGRAVRATANYMKEYNITGYEGIKTMAACYVLVDYARKVNSAHTKITIEGNTVNGENSRDYEIVINHLTKKI